MDEFVSTFTNRIDAKGRVSIPAGIPLGSRGRRLRRPLLLSDARPQRGRCRRQSLPPDDPCACFPDFEPFSEDHDLLSTTFIGESEILKIDQDGRVVLTETIKDHAGIQDQVTFVGHSFKFQMWEPERFAVHREESNNRSRELRKLLGSGQRASGVSQRGGE